MYLSMFRLKEGNKFMDYISTRKAVLNWGVSSRRVQELCRENKIKNARKLGREWLIPKEANFPSDSRKKTFNAIDLFSGAGGLSYGFQSAGFNVLLGIDNDEKALETFKFNHKRAKTLLGDISKITYKDDIKPILGEEKIDFIIGGPPCQGMSLAGNRRLDDPRNKLYLSYLRILKEVNPRGFVIENVPGLVRLFDGKIKDSILERLGNMGYNVRYQILKASNYGVPQNRQRVFFVGLKKGFFEFPEKSEQIITTKMALDDLPDLVNNYGDIEQEYKDVSHNPYQQLMRKRSKVVYNHVAAHHTEKTKKIISMVPDGGNYKDLPEEYRKSRNFHVAWTRFNSMTPAPTIDTGHRHHFHYKFNRVPTVRECARLQSFPDDFIFLGNKTEQFRQVGNAVPPLLAQAIATSLKHF